MQFVRNLAVLTTYRAICVLKRTTPTIHAMSDPSTKYRPDTTAVSWVVVQSNPPKVRQNGKAGGAVKLLVDASSSTLRI